MPRGHDAIGILADAESQVNHGSLEPRGQARRYGHDDAESLAECGLEGRAVWYDDAVEDGLGFGDAGSGADGLEGHGEEG